MHTSVEEGSGSIMVAEEEEDGSGEEGRGAVALL
jgi:hypothetical protein